MRPGGGVQRGKVRGIHFFDEMTGQGGEVRSPYRDYSEWFDREDAARRANFFRLATAVWPRHLRTLAEELGDDEADAAQGGTRRARRVIMSDGET